MGFVFITQNVIESLNQALMSFDIDLFIYLFFIIFLFIYFSLYFCKIFKNLENKSKKKVESIFFKISPHKILHPGQPAQLPPSWYGTGG